MAEIISHEIIKCLQFITQSDIINLLFSKTSYSSAAVVSASKTFNLFLELTKHKNHTLISTTPNKINNSIQKTYPRNSANSRRAFLLNFKVRINIIKTLDIFSKWRNPLKFKSGVLFCTNFLKFFRLLF